MQIIGTSPERNDYGDGASISQSAIWANIAAGLVGVLDAFAQPSD
jgi:hypothetical protein